MTRTASVDHVVEQRATVELHSYRGERPGGRTPAAQPQRERQLDPSRQRSTIAASPEVQHPLRGTRAAEPPLTIDPRPGGSGRSTCGSSRQGRAGDAAWGTARSRARAARFARDSRTTSSRGGRSRPSPRGTAGCRAAPALREGRQVEAEPLRRLDGVEGLVDQELDVVVARQRRRHHRPAARRRRGSASALYTATLTGHRQRRARSRRVAPSTGWRRRVASVRGSISTKAPNARRRRRASRGDGRDRRSAGTATSCFTITAVSRRYT